MTENVINAGRDAAMGNAVFNGMTVFKDNKSGLLFFAAGDTDFNSVKYANAVDAGKNKELKNLCQKMHGDLKNTCLIGK